MTLVRARWVAHFVVALCALSAACVPADPDIDLRRDFPEDTTMGIIQTAGELVIGIPENAPPLGRLGAEGRASGLSVELGAFVAETLGVEPRWVGGTNADLISLTEIGSLDLAFVTNPLTEEIVKEHNFAGPYYIGHQRLLVPTGEGSPGAMEGPVCAALHPDVGVDLTATRPALEIVAVPRVEACLGLLESGAARSATAMDASLIRLKTQLGNDWRIVGDELSTVGLGTIVPPRVPAYQRFVAAVLGRAEREEVWSDAYARLLQPHLGPAEPPPLSVEEAAALHPTLVEARRAGG
ncbi:MAG: transporter substrate-binding domain-containing protein [Actinomycetota bacterium]|nr:transporter substrate-binding domain-containing protein [Actinomycetota bacterium]